MLQKDTAWTIRYNTLAIATSILLYSIYSLPMKNQSQQEQSDSIVTDVQLSKSKTPDQFKD